MRNLYFTNEFIAVAHQTGRIGQPKYGRTVDDDLSVSVPERKVETRRARSVEDQSKPVRRTRPKIH